MLPLAGAVAYFAAFDGNLWFALKLNPPPQGGGNRLRASHGCSPCIVGTEGLPATPTVSYTTSSGHGPQFRKREVI